MDSDTENENENEEMEIQIENQENQENESEQQTPTVIKKKRGRKPKNTLEEQVVVEKKKRGRKKKYEIENFDKIINRDQLNNFNHNIVYSSDEEVQHEEHQTQEKTNENKTISFGNLNITISKKSATEQPEENVNLFKGMLRNNVQLINEDELESDEEKEIPIENIISSNQEKFYKETKKYVTDFTESIKDQSVKRLRVVTCCKNVVKEDQWPSDCSVCCWWCCHKFDNIPCTLPTKYDSLRKRFTFMGLFCSWNCAKGYNNNMSDYRKHERSQLITFLVQQLYGIEKAINIKPAPPREALKMFGGYLEIEEFRNRYSTIESYHTNLNKNNFIFPEIAEVTNIKIKPQTSEKKNALRLTRN